MTELTRCAWAKHELDVKYHDEEWGRETHGDEKLFEMLTLEGAQAGLSWTTILMKREGYREVFHHWNIARIANMVESDVERLRQDARIVRNKLKIESTISNAKATLQLYKEGTCLDDYFWNWVEGKPIINRFETLADLPAQTDLSKAISKDLKKRGFRFVGPTIVYAFMQATGMVCDHTIDCFCHPENQ